MDTHRKIVLIIAMLMLTIGYTYSQAPAYPSQPGTVQPGSTPTQPGTNRPGDNVLPNQQPGSIQPGMPGSPTPAPTVQPGAAGMTGNNGTGSQGSQAPSNQNPGTGNGGFPNTYPGNRGVSGPTGKN